MAVFYIGKSLADPFSPNKSMTHLRIFYIRPQKLLKSSFSKTHNKNSKTCNKKKGMFVINDHWYSSFVDIVFDDGDAAAYKFFDVKALTQVCSCSYQARGY